MYTAHRTVHTHSMCVYIWKWIMVISVSLHTVHRLRTKIYYGISEQQLLHIERIKLSIWNVYSHTFSNWNWLKSTARLRNRSFARNLISILHLSLRLSSSLTSFRFVQSQVLQIYLFIYLLYLIFVVFLHDRFQHAIDTISSKQIEFI